MFACRTRVDANHAACALVDLTSVLAWPAAALEIAAVEELAAEVLQDQVSFWTHGSELQSWPGVSPDACQLCHHSAEEEAE